MSLTNHLEILVCLFCYYRTFLKHMFSIMLHESFQTTEVLFYLSAVLL